MPISMIFRRLAYGLIGRYDRWATMKRPADEPSHTLSFIIMAELTRIGDVLATTPVYRAVRKKYPEAEITCLVRETSKDILRHNPYVDHVIGVPEGANPFPFLDTLAEVRRGKPDLAISLSPSLKNSIVAHFCGARYTVGYLNDRSPNPHFFKDHLIESRGFAYEHLVRYHRDEHLTIRAAKAVASLNVQCPDRRLDFFLDPRDQAKAERLVKKGHLRIVVHTTSGWRHKSWPEDRFTKLLLMIQSHLQGQPLQIILIGHQRDRETLSRINRSVGGGLTVIQGYSLSVVGAMIRNANLFIGNDSGPLHMADAFGTPFVGIFGPSLPETTGPLSDGICVSKRLPCTPCSQTTCSRAKRGEATCMELIEVATVFRAVVESLTNALPLAWRHQV